MLKADYIPYTLKFREPAGTSRGVLHTKQTYFVRVYDDAFPSRAGYGEAALFRGLSAEEGADYAGGGLQRRLRVYSRRLAGISFFVFRNGNGACRLRRRGIAFSLGFHFRRGGDSHKRFDMDGELRSYAKACGGETRGGLPLYKT